jgi:hypothetical protein
MLRWGGMAGWAEVAPWAVAAESAWGFRELAAWGVREDRAVPEERATGLEAPEQLKVAQKGSEVDMTDPQYRERELFTDGRKIEKSKDAMQIPVKAHWDHETLVTEEQGPNGEKISHRYELAPDGKQLTDTLTLESKKLKNPVIIRSVYDKTGSENAQ